MFHNLSKLHSFHQSQSSHELEDAPDKPPVLFVTSIVVICFLFVFGVIVFAYPMTQKLVDYQENIANPGMANNDLRNYINVENNLLKSSKEIDADHAQVPIDDAMKKTVEAQGDLSKISGTLNK